ncbi:MAG: DNA repair protein RecO [Lachnospiraceae bacterium]|nr:DNA repair protein RecO [Lachnospiraceae bacterium]
MDKVCAAGVVLLSQPVGEYDRRLVILTRERGKITAFAHGARKMNSPLMAASNPFVFARFLLFQGRNAYTLAGVEDAHYFTELAGIQPGIYLGFYFLELASYYGREGIESADMVNLLFVALKAVIKGKIPLPLLRRIFELRMLVINGDYAPSDEDADLNRDARYALCFVSSAGLSELFSFVLDPDAEQVFSKKVEEALERTIDRRFKSLEMYEFMSQV